MTHKLSSFETLQARSGKKKKVPEALIELNPLPLSSHTMMFVFGLAFTAC